MNTKSLKQKILDLAIRGKLVPQDPNDEPASVLLQRIRAEREQLIAQGKIKRTKTTSDNQHYENVPFEIPASWVWTTIKDICSKIGSGSTPRGSNYAPSGIPFFRSQNVYDNGLVYDDIKYISPDVHKGMINTEVIANDVLLNITGGSLGRCAIVPSDFTIGNVSQHVCILRPIYVSSEYLHFFCLSTFFAQTMVISGSGREGLPKYSLEKMQIPIPPFSEQKRIVAEVEKWYSVIDEIETNKSELQECIKQAKSQILSLAISGKLVPQDPSDEPAVELLKRINPAFQPCDTSHYENLPLEIPQNWVWVKLKDVAKVIHGRNQSAVINPNGQYPIYGSGGIMGYADDYLCPEHCTIVGRKGTINNPILVETKFWNVDTAFGLHPNDAIDYLYFHYFCKGFDFTKLDKSTTLPSLTKTSLEQIDIPLPPLKEQTRIVQKINDIFTQLDKITAEL